MAWVSYQTDKFPPMTEADKKNNVSIIWEELGAKGYTLEAVAAICGNMESEGILNPGQYEIGRNYDIYKYGAGLCGWTPVYVSGVSSTHLGNWCDSQGLNWLDGDSQLAYLHYELTDWGGTERFSETAKHQRAGILLTRQLLPRSSLRPRIAYRIWPHTGCYIMSTPLHLKVLWQVERLTQKMVRISVWTAYSSTTAYSY